MADAVEKTTVPLSGPRFGIFQRVFVLLIVFVLVPVLLITVYMVSTIHDVGDEINEKTTVSLNEKTIDMLELQASETATQIGVFLKNIEADLQTIKEAQPSAGFYLTFLQNQTAPVWERGHHHQTVDLPLYKEIAFIAPSGRELIKVEDGTVARGERLKNVSDPRQTRYGVEEYFARTKSLQPGEIYVSRLVGFFVDKKEQLQGAQNLDDAPGGVYYDGVIRFCAPVYEGNKLAGMVTLALDQRHLMGFTQHLLPLSKEKVLFPSYNSGNYAFLFDDQGWIITHPKLWDIKGVDRQGNWIPAYTETSTQEQIDRGYIPFNLDSTGFVHPNYPIVAQKVRQKHTGTLITTNVGGITKIMAYAPVLYSGGVYAEHGVFGGVTVGAELIGFNTSAAFVSREIESLIAQVKSDYFLFMLLALLTAMMTAWFFSRQLTKPIVSLTEGAGKIARGDLGKEINVNRSDEIGTLARVFNSMAGELKKNRSRLLSTIDELKTSKGKAEEYARELEYQIEIFKSIQSISNILGSTFDVNTVIRLILEKCVKSIGFDRAILYLIDDRQKYLACRETYGFSAENERVARRSRYHLQRFDCIETRVVKEGRIIFVEDFNSYSQQTKLDKKIREYTKSNSFVFVPLRVQEKIIGIMGADKIRSQKDISSADINSLQILANQASRVIENTRLYGEIIDQRNFVENVFKYMLNGLITVSSEGQITSMNKAAMEVLEIKDFRPYQNITELFRDNSQMVERIRQQILHRGFFSGYNLEFSIAGKTKFLNVHASQFKSEQGANPDSVIILEDVTDKKQLDEQVQQLEKLASLGRFAAKVAHEIRNPLTGISLFIDDLVNHLNDKPDILPLLEKAQKEIERLEKLTHEILVFTHPASGGHHAGDINEVIKTIMDFLSIQCKKAHVQIEMDLDENIGESLFNPDRMKQALLNIMLNAVEAMPEGGMLSVSSKLQEKEKGEWIRIDVRDTGIGIKTAELGKIFEPFYSSKKKGTGLGLSTTYNIISDHKGIIRVDSMRKRGTLITVLLPRTRPGKKAELAKRESLYGDL